MGDNIITVVHIYNYIHKKLSVSKAWRHIWGAEIQHRSFFTLALDGNEWSASRAGRFIPRQEPQYPLCRRLGQPQGRYQGFRKEKHLLPSAGIRMPSLLSVNLGTIQSIIQYLTKTQDLNSAHQEAWSVQLGTRFSIEKHLSSQFKLCLCCPHYSVKSDLRAR